MRCALNINRFGVCTFLVACLVLVVVAAPARASLITGMFDNGDVFTFGSISDFQTNTGGDFVGNRALSGSTTSLFSDGSTVYGYLPNGDVFSWASVSDFQTDTGATFLGNRVLSNNGANNSLAMDGTGAVTALLFNGDVFSWTSVGNFISDTGAAFLGSRGGVNGANTAIAQDVAGTVNGSLLNGDVFTWASSSAFATDTGAMFVGPRTAGGNGMNVTLLSSVPEPTSLAMFSVALLGLSPRRRKGTAKLSKNCVG